MSTFKYQLTVEEGPDKGKLYPLNAPSLTIGRDPMSDVVLSDPEVSRYHARLTQTAVGGYKIEDMKSTNSTHIDGMRLESEPMVLKNGQTILLGSTVKLRYDLADNDESAVTMMQMTGEDNGMDAINNRDTKPDTDGDLFAPPLPQTDGKLPLPMHPVPDYDHEESTENAMPELPYVAPTENLSPPPQDKNKKRNMVLGITAVLFLLCCCCIIFPAIMYYWLGDILLEMGGLV